jgi:Predicted hydrolase (metallo-beta-lactamase superfamily)
VYKLYVLNVGHGDSLVLEVITQQCSKWVVIDCHNRNPHVDSPTLQLLKKNNVDRIELVVLTHPDLDHYSGLHQLIEYYSQPGKSIGAFKGVVKVDNGFFGLINSDSEISLVELHELVVDLAKQGKLEFDYLSKDVQFDVTPDLIIRALSPSGISYDRFISQAIQRSQNANSKVKIYKNIISSVLTIEGHDHRTLLCSDASRNVLNEVLENWKRRQKERKETRVFQVVKVSHHGSNEENHRGLWKDFTKRKKSKAAISAGRRDHPGLETIKEIINNKVDLFCTNRCDALGGYRMPVVQNLLDKGLTPLKIEALGLATLPVITTKNPLHGDITFSYDVGSIIVNTQTGIGPIQTLP